MPNLHLDDTIAAIATPSGEGGIAVIRVSGPEALSLVGKIFRPKKGALFEFLSHTIHLGSIFNEKDETIDQVLASLFRAPHSYTGEDVIEISSHGGMVVSRNVLDLLIQEGARHAEPGEFTKRAFLNGKIDLTQAEAVLDLIKAKSDQSLKVAVKQLAGSLSQKFKSLKNELMMLYAHLEAALDFPDEHLEVFSDRETAGRLDQLEGEMETLIKSFKRGALLREGAKVVIVGKPNVGKSSLFNALLARDRALVSEFRGTTRDTLEEALEIQGFYVRLIDTAGLASTPGHPVDRLGMERTREVLREADLTLYMVDGSEPIDQEDKLVFEAAVPGKKALILINKCDLKSALDPKELRVLTGSEDFLPISTKTREGFDALEKRIADIMLEGGIAEEGEQVTRLRHKHALEKALASLTRCRKSFSRQESLEIVILDLKAAMDELAELVGEIYSEDLLDVIFSEFCIGK